MANSNPSTKIRDLLRITTKGPYLLANGWVVDVDIIHTKVGAALPLSDGNWSHGWWKRNGQPYAPLTEEYTIVRKLPPTAPITVLKRPTST